MADANDDGMRLSPHGVTVATCFNVHSGRPFVVIAGLGDEPAYLDPAHAAQMGADLLTAQAVALHDASLWRAMAKRGWPEPAIEALVLEVGRDSGTGSGESLIPDAPPASWSDPPE